MPLTSEPAEERRALRQQRLHGVHVRTTKDHDRLGRLEEPVPCMLQRGQHSRISLGSIGQLVQQKNLPSLAQECRYRLPAGIPRVKRRITAEVHTQHRAEQLATLQSGRLALGSPIDGRKARPLCPATQLPGLADTPPAIQKNHLRRSRPIAPQDGRQEGKFGLAIYKHASPEDWRQRNPQGQSHP
jgi:hypothetical protein